MIHPKERIASPNLHALSCTTSGSSSPNQLDVPLLSPWKKSKSKMGCVVQLRSNEDSQQSDLESYHFTKSSTSFKIGDGGVSFKEMTNKRMFLHDIKVYNDLYFSDLIFPIKPFSIFSNFKAKFISSFINDFSCMLLYK